MVCLFDIWSSFKAYDGFLYDWGEELVSYSAVNECFTQKKTQMELKTALEVMMKEISQSTAFPNIQGFQVNNKLENIVRQLK